MFQILRLSLCDIAHIDTTFFDTLMSLTTISIRSCSLHAVPPIHAVCDTLESFSIENTNIYTPIKNNYFTKCTKLRGKQDSRTTHLD